MLRKSELAIIKDGVLTISGYSFAMVYKMLGICANPGVYAVKESGIRKEYNFMSNGKGVWLVNENNELVANSLISKEELNMMLEKLIYATKHATRYYLIDDILFRESKNKLYYLSVKPGLSRDIEYIENSIPLSVIFKILRPDFPSKSEKEAGIFNSRLDSIKKQVVDFEYLDKYSEYFGYTKIYDYYVLMSLDDIVRIDTIEDNKLKTFKVPSESLKQAIII